MQVKLRAKFGCSGRGKNKINVFIKKKLQVDEQEAARKKAIIIAI